MNEILQAMAESSIGQAIIARSEARSKAEGRIQGLIWAVQIMWLCRFGVMSAVFVAALERLSDEQLQEFIALFGKGATANEMRAHLGI